VTVTKTLLFDLPSMRETLIVQVGQTPSMRETLIVQVGQTPSMRETK
jgi:hypothetical protein